MKRELAVNKSIHALPLPFTVIKMSSNLAKRRKRDSDGVNILAAESKQGDENHHNDEFVITPENPRWPNSKHRWQVCKMS